MIMGRLITTWFCYLLMILNLYVLFKVDCIHSDLAPFISSSPNSTAALSHPKECSALLQFKNTTYKVFPDCKPCNGSEPFVTTCSKTDSWTEGKDCCSWDGVRCDFETGSVLELDLSNTCLRGTLNLSFLVQLPHLTSLHLFDNSLTGFIPTSLSELQNLSVLSLSENMFSGQIPDIFSNLRQMYSIDLSYNKFSGPIPYSLCDLPKLSELLLSNNFLDGRVPSCLFNMSALSYLDLSNNQLSGPIGKFKPISTVLEEFYFGNNKINGPIPSSIFELVNLTHLDLSSNNLNGTFKFDLLPKYFKCLLLLVLSENSLLSFSFNINVKDISSIVLQDLRLSSCNISEIPSFLSSLENLMELELSNNRIHGQILKNRSKGWASLNHLDLSHNFLTYAEHPWEKIAVIDLQNNSLQGSLLVPPLGTQFFLVSNNKLTGTIPPSFCNLSWLLVLDLSSNNLGGKIPECLGNVNRLEMLHLRDNSFHGRIPNKFVNGSWIKSLDLSDNNLEGSLPRSLNMCRNLQVINVGNNNISDTFPYWLGNLPDLQIIILKSNQFYGSINDSKTTFPSLRILDLSYNKFVGRFSKKFFENLKAMMFADEESYDKNRYMAEVCVGSTCVFNDYFNLISSLSLVMKGQLVNFQKVLRAFRAMDLSNNCFEGTIPEILGKLRLLKVLNLSHNSLTGNIPSSIGNMTALESLDLSSNKLDGRIPEQMQSLTFLEVLNFSYNRLSGPIPQGAQFATYESESFVGNKGLCGKPLLKKCHNDSVPLLPPFLQKEDDTTNEFSWKIAMMGYGCGLVIGLSIGYIVVSTGKLQRLEKMVEGQLLKVRRPC